MLANRRFLWVLIPLIAVAAASCATAVTFDVEHPPLVDLRGANTITVIPFEWNSVREYAYLSQRVTTALLTGLRRGNVDIVDPYTLGYAGGRNYGQYGDVYIIGRIININAYEQIETINDGNQTIIRENFTRTADVDIEYSYIRSVDNKTLGDFRKSKTAVISFEQTRYRDQDRGRNAGYNMPRDINRNTARRGEGRGASSGALRSLSQPRSWQASIAESAIAQFADTMAQELGSWAGTERRKVKGKTGNDQLAARAKNYIEYRKYNEALALYKTIYEQNGNIAAGYNVAILLAANEQFADALGLLERLRDRLLNEGKSIPSFIKNEIKKMAGFINEHSKLEPYNASEIKMIPIAPIPETERIMGEVNVPQGIVYALNGSVSSINDDSIFPKMVASADVFGGQWFMRIPNAAPAQVWLLVTDGRREHYITKTAIQFSGTITLNTATMTKLN